MEGAEDCVQMQEDVTANEDTALGLNVLIEMI